MRVRNFAVAAALLAGCSQAGPEAQGEPTGCAGQGVMLGMGFGFDRSEEASATLRENFADYYAALEMAASELRAQPDSTLFEVHERTNQILADGTWDPKRRDEILCCVSA